MRWARVAVALTVGLSVGVRGQQSEIRTLVRSLELDPPVELDVDCPPPPDGAERLLVAAVFSNTPPIRPGSPGFPSDFCPANTGFFARAEGRGKSALLGDFQWSERYCTVSGAGLIAEGDWRGASGDHLAWTARIRSDSVPPPIPFATFSGTIMLTGGTGAFVGAAGQGLVTAKQLGDAAPGRPAGSTATVVCGWVRRG